MQAFQGDGVRARSYVGLFVGLGALLPLEEPSLKPATPATYSPSMQQVELVHLRMLRESY